MPTGLRVAFLRLRAARRWPFRPARKRLRPFHTRVLSTPESEINRRCSLGRYVIPDGSGLGVDQREVFVTRTTWPAVAARAGGAAMISEPAMNTRRTDRLHRFIETPRRDATWPHGGDLTYVGPPPNDVMSVRRM